MELVVMDGKQRCCLAKWRGLAQEQQTTSGASFSTLQVNTHDSRLRAKNRGERNSQTKVRDRQKYSVVTKRERGQITSQKGSIQPRAQVAETVNIAISSRAADQTKQSAYAACCRYLPLLLWAHMTRQKDAGYSHRHRVCDTVLLMVHSY